MVGIGPGHCLGVGLESWLASGERDGTELQCEWGHSFKPLLQTYKWPRIWHFSGVVTRSEKRPYY